ncbi:serine hydrolase domain-containing protein [Paracraurococcus lichenis]|uniref:Serine hydrolase domain-containing protein n=1 Tax=Paracraurococcus lichenis TaxID=3064888 RepID=A0ABT9E351_9PROT|nr:serine hydrolase domain-containing protein [Paracraurococcus sp. LOR1-02]MDO9710588.1 serine hydrolase domain-containing protein [Paracraurococcus sp. LOR1-02]
MPNRAAIDAVLQRTVEAGAVPGVVALAADRNGVVYEGAFGRRDLSAAAPMTLDTVFWIASMTKAVTSVAAMRLVEERRLELDAPLGGLLPDLAAPEVLEGFAPDGTPRLRPAKRPITLRHLLTHTAGFSYNTWNAGMARYMEITGLPAPRSGRLASLRAPLVRDPGEAWEYSIATDWAGRVVEAAGGAGLDVLLRGLVLGPLGMADTGHVPGPSQQARRARVHQRDGQGALSPIDFALPEAPEFLGGGGGLLSTGLDYLRFLRMLLGGGALDGARVLRPETVAEMARNQIGALEFRPLRTTMPAVSNDFDPFPEMSRKFGLGFLINTQDLPGRRAAGSLAWAGLGNTWFWVDPGRGMAGVLLTQILPFADHAVLDLLAGFETAVYAG